MSGETGKSVGDGQSLYEELLNKSRHQECVARIAAEKRADALAAENELLRERVANLQEALNAPAIHSEASNTIALAQAEERNQ